MQHLQKWLLWHNAFRVTVKLCAAIACMFVLLFAYVPAFAASNQIKDESPTPTITQMNCVQPPINVDHAALSNVELDKYGLPHYKTGEDKTRWINTVRAMKHRICGGTSTHFSNVPSPAKPLVPMTPGCSSSGFGNDIWTGNMTVNSSTDSSCHQNNSYTEADAVFYVPCIKSGSPTGAESSWVGLGGWHNKNLVQAGTHSGVSYFLGIPTYEYYAWTQNVASSNVETRLFNVNCGDRMQVYAYHSNETYIIDHNSGNYSTTYNGPAASYDTAEWIVERPAYCNPTCSPQPLADFQSETFYGMGTTVGSGYCSNCYVSPADVDHDYAIMNNNRTNIGSIGYNTAWGPPNYANTITWHQA